MKTTHRTLHTFIILREGWGGGITRRLLQEKRKTMLCRAFLPGAQALLEALGRTDAFHAKCAAVADYQILIEEGN